MEKKVGGQVMAELSHWPYQIHRRIADAEFLLLLSCLRSAGEFDPLQPVMFCSSMTLVQRLPSLVGLRRGTAECRLTESSRRSNE